MIYTSLVLTLIVSFILLFNYWSTNKTVGFLVIAILGVSIRQLISLMLNLNGDSFWAAIFYLHFDPFIILIGPATFFYFKSIITGKFIKDNTLIFHLIPATFILINISPIFNIPFAEKIAYIEQLQLLQNPLLNPFPYLIIPYRLQSFFITVVNFSYGFYTLSYLFKLRESGTTYIKKKIGNIIKYGVFIVMVISVLAMLFHFYLFTLPQSNKIVSEPVMKSFFYFFSLILPISFFFSPSWLYGEKEGVNILKRFLFSLKKTDLISSNHSVDLNLHESTDLNRILIYLEENQPFLNEKFSLNDISQALSIPYMRITNIFNKHLLIPFPVYRNRLRVQYALKLLQAGEHKKSSIDGIALKSGFKSKTSFYKAFKDEYGVTPNLWIKENLQ
jgi:AraC-like DNA-binding protein